MKKAILLFILLVIIVLGGFILYSYFTVPVQKSELNSLENNSIGYSVGECSPYSKTFVCRPITQGMPNNNAPIVCGCMPQCKPDETLFISPSKGIWPDGSQKGSFGCTKENLPPESVKLIGR